jgi:hypothetical protein
MPFLVILKRFEVWLLLAIVAALVAFAFQPGPSPEDPTAPVGGPVMAVADPDKLTNEDPAALPEETSVLSLGGVVVEPSGGGWIVETTLAGRSPTGADLVLDESSVTAANDRGEPVARFFEPFRGSAALAGGEDSMATLRWWLPRPAESLRLDVGGASLAVDLP